jgi:transcriptional regulator with XRE-family HTH domain
MVASESPAGARRRLRLALRNLRDRRELTQQQVADELDWSLSKVNRIENGDVTISVSDLRAALNLYKIEDEDERASLIDAARAARKRDTTYDAFRREDVTPAMVTLGQFERDAVAIRTFYPALVDGLLQTPEYAAAILEYVGPGLDADARTARLEFRLRRQRDVLERDDPPRVLSLLDESVLHRAVGGTGVLVRQLDHLLAAAERPNVTVRVIRMTDGAMLALLPAFSILDLRGEDNALLYQERVLDDAVVEDEEVVRHYRDRFEDGWALALDEVASRRLVETRRAELLATLDRKSAGG